MEQIKMVKSLPVLRCVGVGDLLLLQSHSRIATLVLNTRKREWVAFGETVFSETRPVGRRCVLSVLRYAFWNGGGSGGLGGGGGGSGGGGGGGDDGSSGGIGGGRGIA